MCRQTSKYSTIISSESIFMAMHFQDTLTTWLPLKDQHKWVLGAVIRTSGSVYRKTGALMLLSDAGHQLGLLSGGCLEGDLLLQARKVCALGSSRRVIYDASDEGGVAWRLGIGCGGLAEILLQPCNADNGYLQLPQVAEFLAQGYACTYALGVHSPWAKSSAAPKAFCRRTAGELLGEGEQEHLATLINPLPHLLVYGSGMDMVPLCEMALVLGWQVTLVDHRLNPQKRARFPSSISAVVETADVVPQTLLQNADAAIVAYHNMQLDAAAVAALQFSQCQYLGLLGPERRKREVLALAGLRDADLHLDVAGPAGLALGGDLPENVALSMLAEIHAVLFGSTAKPLSQVFLRD
jgi:xanthine dehydrogenase accessory factor